MEKVDKIKREVKFHKLMIPIVMLTAPIMIPLNILSVMQLKRLQIRQWNATLEALKKAMKEGKCICQKCDGSCHA